MVVQDPDEPGRLMPAELLIVGELTEPITPNPALCFNTVLYEPMGGIAWCRIHRGQHLPELHIGASRFAVPTWAPFPRSVPGSVIGPTWTDETYCWQELGPLALRREIGLMEVFAQRLHSPMLSGYNSPTNHPPELKLMQEDAQKVMVTLAEMRLKLSKGELSDEQLRDALKLLRQARVSAGAKSEKARTSKTPVDAGALMKQLFG